MTFDADIFWQQVFSEAFLRGALISITVAILAQVLGVVLGFLLALGVRTRNHLIRGLCGAYVWLFRAIPTLLVLLILWNAAPQVLPILRESWYNPFVAAVIGLGLAEAAYMAEIFRSALASVDEGQPLAARALGMKPSAVLFKVVLPQAVRVAIPPTGNDFIAMVKYTSLASVISLKELLTTAQLGVSTTFRYAEFYAAATVYYLVIVSALMILQRFIEKRFEWSSAGRRPGRRRARPTADAAPVTDPARPQPESVLR